MRHLYSRYLICYHYNYYQSQSSILSIPVRLLAWWIVPIYLVRISMAEGLLRHTSMHEQGVVVLQEDRGLGLVESRTWDILGVRV